MKELRPKALVDLLLLWQDGSISGPDVAELKRRLADRAARTSLVDDFFMSAVIVDTLAKERKEQKEQKEQKERKERKDPKESILPNEEAPARTRPAGADARALLRGPAAGPRGRSGRPRRVRALRRARSVPFAAWATAAAAALLLAALRYIVYAPEEPTPPLAVREEPTRQTPGPAPVLPAPLAEVAAVSAPAFVDGRGPEIVRLKAGTRTRLAVAEGDAVFPGDLIETGRGSATVRYAREATTLELRELTSARFRSEDGAKRIDLERGAMRADAALQPARRPLVILTPGARATVLGTRFTIEVAPDEPPGVARPTRLEVHEGRVRLTRTSDGASVTVAAGEYAVACEGAELVARHLDEAVAGRGRRSAPVETDRIEVDFSDAVFSGHGAWRLQDGAWIQSVISRQPGDSVPAPTSNILFPLRRQAGQPVRGVVIDATVTVTGVTPDREMGRGAWGFGVLVRVSGRTFVFRTIQNTHATEPGIEIKSIDQRVFPITKRGLLHGREGTYRLKLRAARLSAGGMLLQGKLWRGGAEPGDWMIEAQVAGQSAVDWIGLTTTRCACVFEKSDVFVVKEQPPGAR